MRCLGGLDLEDANSPSETVFSGIADAIKLGLLSESQVDESVSRLMYVRMRTGEFDDPGLQPYRKLSKDHIRSKAHLALTRQVATESLVLLQNYNRTLPLTPVSSHPFSTMLPSLWFVSQPEQRSQTAFVVLNTLVALCNLTCRVYTQRLRWWAHSLTVNHATMESTVHIWIHS